MKKILILTVVVVLMFSVTGCLKKTPEKMIQNMIKQMSQLEGYNMDIKLSVNGQFPQLTSLDSTTGLYPGAIIALFSGDVDLSDEKSLNYQMAGEIKYRLETSEIVFKGDLVSKDNVFYVKFSDVPDLKIADLSAMVGSWYKFDLNSLGVGNQLAPKPSKDDLQKAKKLKKLFGKTNFLEIVKDNGIDEIDGVRVHHYDVKVDREGMEEFFEQASQISEGRSLTDLEKQEIAKTMQTLGMFDGSVWIGEKDNYLYRIELAGEQKTEDKGMRRYDIVLKFRDFDKKVSVNTPTDVKQFNMMELLMPDFDNFAPELDAAENGDLFEQLKDIEGVDPEELQKQLEELQLQLNNN
jgi:hypothetical protein